MTEPKYEPPSVEEVQTDGYCRLMPPTVSVYDFMGTGDRLAPAWLKAGPANSTAVKSARRPAVVVTRDSAYLICDAFATGGDGLMDAESAAEELFGNDRLCRTLEHLPIAPPWGAVGEVLNVVSKLQAWHKHFNDETLVVLRVR